MNILTPTEAQAYLAEQLRERLKIRYYRGLDKPEVYWFGGTHSNGPVLETEWLSIAHEVEGKMNEQQFTNYQIQLARVVFNHPSAVTYPVGFSIREFWLATYTQRATAMKESGMKI